MLEDLAKKRKYEDDKNLSSKKFKHNIKSNISPLSLHNLQLQTPVLVSKSDPPFCFVDGIIEVGFSCQYPPMSANNADTEVMIFSVYSILNTSRNILASEAGPADVNYNKLIDLIWSDTAFASMRRQRRLVSLPSTNITLKVTGGWTESMGSYYDEYRIIDIYSFASALTKLDGESKLYKYKKPWLLQLYIEVGAKGI